MCVCVKGGEYNTEFAQCARHQSIAIDFRQLALATTTTTSSRRRTAQRQQGREGKKEGGGYGAEGEHSWWLIFLRHRVGRINVRVSGASLQPPNRRYIELKGDIDAGTEQTCVCVVVCVRVCVWVNM